MKPVKYVGGNSAREPSTIYLSGRCSIIFKDCMYDSWDFSQEYITLAFTPENFSIAMTMAMLLGIQVRESKQYPPVVGKILMDVMGVEQVIKVSEELWKKYYRTYLNL